MDVIGVADTIRLGLPLFAAYGDFVMSVGPLMLWLVDEAGDDDKNGYG